MILEYSSINLRSPVAKGRHPTHKRMLDVGGPEPLANAGTVFGRGGTPPGFLKYWSDQHSTKSPFRTVSIDYNDPLRPPVLRIKNGIVEK